MPVPPIDLGARNAKSVRAYAVGLISCGLAVIGFGFLRGEQGEVVERGFPEPIEVVAHHHQPRLIDAIQPAGAGHRFDNEVGLFENAQVL